MTYEKFASYDDLLGTLLVVSLLVAVAVVLLTGWKAAGMVWLFFGVVYVLHMATCAVWASYRFWRRAGRRD